MQEDRVARIYRQMLEDLQALGPKWFGDFQEETSKWIDDQMKGVLDPSKLAAWAKAMGIDMSQLPGIMSQQPGFDPYRILGLEKSASDEEVKKRYRERVRQFHPDTAGSGMEFHFQCTLTAYEMIKKMRGWQ